MDKIAVPTDLPSPPFVYVEGVHNFRDIGGYPIPAAPGTSVARGRVYRAADPSGATPAGIAELRARRVSALYDLRSAPEVDKAVLGPPLAVEGIERIEVPAFANQDYSPEAIAVRYRDYIHGGVEGFTRAYLDILRNAGPGAFRTILLHVADRPTEPLVLHCSAGKDRTGVIVAIILGIAGVSDEVIANEYALTTQGLGPLRAIIKNHLLENPALGGDPERAERMSASNADYMRSAMVALRKEWGSPEGYARKECGLSEEQIARVCANMRSDEAPIL